MRALAVAVTSFVAMEPVTYAVHRWLMHGPGEAVHRSHHRTRRSRLEANDAYPAVFATLTMALLAAGFNVAGWAWLVPVAAGVSAYGILYVAVHDGCIHGRIPGLRRLRWQVLGRLAGAHRVHHLYGGEPYGMLVPVVPRDLRARADRAARDPLDRAPLS